MINIKALDLQVDSFSTPPLNEPCLAMRDHGVKQYFQISVKIKIITLNLFSAWFRIPVARWSVKKGSIVAKVILPRGGLIVASSRPDQIRKYTLQAKGYTYHPPKCIVRVISSPSLHP